MDDVFDAIEAAMKRAAANCSAAEASAAAERHGLVEQGAEKLSQKFLWVRTEGDRTLLFQHRWYDQSKAFSIQPDMNIMTLELQQSGKVLRKAQAQFED